MLRTAAPLTPDVSLEAPRIGDALRALRRACAETGSETGTTLAWRPARGAVWQRTGTDDEASYDEEDALTVARRMGVFGDAQDILWEEPRACPTTLLRLTRDDVALYARVLRSMARGHMGVVRLAVPELDALLRVRLRTSSAANALMRSHQALPRCVRMPSTPRARWSPYLGRHTQSKPTQRSCRPARSHGQLRCRWRTICKTRRS